jgi:predicted solute-binding protein
MTGLPFVYAMWMCRRAQAGSDVISTTAAVLDRQVRHNLTRLDWIIREYAPRHRWPIDLATRYLSELLRFRVGERERAAVARFFAEVAGLEGKPPVVPNFYSRSPGIVPCVG